MIAELSQIFVIKWEKGDIQQKRGRKCKDEVKVKSDQLVIR